MNKWYIMFPLLVLLLALNGCTSLSNDNDTSATKVTQSATNTNEIEPPILTYDSIEYWEIVQDEIVSMLNQHNLYISAITSGYPSIQFYVEPGVELDGKIVASGLSQETYKELFESIKIELHIILDKYKLAKPKSIFHGCHSNLDIFFSNWVVDENKIYDNVYSRDVACYGLDLLEYYHEYDEGAYIQRNAFHAEIWSKYPVFIPD